MKFIYYNNQNNEKNSTNNEQQPELYYVNKPHTINRLKNRIAYFFSPMYPHYSDYYQNKPTLDVNNKITPQK